MLKLPTQVLRDRVGNFGYAISAAALPVKFFDMLVLQIRYIEKVKVLTIFFVTDTTVVYVTIKIKNWLICLLLNTIFPCIVFVL